MQNAEKRHIFAPTYGDENRLGRYALIEIHPNTVAIALDAQRWAFAFDQRHEGYYGDSQVTTPELGGEFIYESIPAELEEWLTASEWGEFTAVLLPVEWNSLLEDIKAKYPERDTLRWDCRACRYIADKDDIRMQAADAHQPDSFVWTSDLWPFFSALQVDFGTPGFTCGVQPGGAS